MSFKQFFIACAVIALASAGACKNKSGEEPVEEKPIVTEENQLCENTCTYGKDGECDDGGPDAITDYCDLGTDCDDCGKRYVLYVKD